MGKENADLLCEVLGTRSDLMKELKGLREATAWKRPEPNEWSVVEVLHHVADVDLLMARRLREIQEGKAELSGNNPAEWESARKEAERDGLAGVLRRAYTARLEVLNVVSDLTPADLQRAGRHPRYGMLTARELVSRVGNHDLDHAQQIAKTRAAVEA